MMAKLAKIAVKRQKPILYAFLIWNIVFFVLVMTPGQICMAVNAYLGGNQMIAGIAILVVTFLIMTEICKRSSEAFRPTWSLLAIITFAEIVFASFISFLPAKLVWQMLPKV